MQALARRPFVVRDAVPLGSAGATRLLDSLAGPPRLGPAHRGPAGRARRRRHRLRARAQRDPARCPGLATGRRHAVARRVRLRRVASFGPLTGAYGESDSLTVDYRTLVAAAGDRDLRRRRRAVRPPRGDRRPRARHGGPENLLGVTEATGRRDVARRQRRGGRRRRRRRRARGCSPTASAAVRSTSAPRPTTRHSCSSADDPGRSGRSVIDYTSDPGGRSDDPAVAGRAVRHRVVVGLGRDRDPAPRPGQRAGRCARRRPAHPLGERHLRRRRSGSGSASTSMAHGRLGHDDLGVGQGRRSPPSPRSCASRRPRARRRARCVPVRSCRCSRHPGRTSWIRITLARVGEGARRTASPSTRSASPASSRPHSRASPSGDGNPDAVLLQEGARGRSECLTLDAVARCSPTLGQEWEETGWSRQWTAERPATYAASGTVRALDGPAAERLLALPSGIEATASSRLVDAPPGRPEAALDGDPGTGWVAGEVDPAPWFSVRLPEPRVLDGLTFTKSFDLAASTPSRCASPSTTAAPLTRRADARGPDLLPRASGPGPCDWPSVTCDCSRTSTPRPAGAPSRPPASASWSCAVPRTC